MESKLLCQFLVYITVYFRLQLPEIATKRFSGKQKIAKFLENLYRKLQIGDPVADPKPAILSKNELHCKYILISLCTS